MLNKEKIELIEEIKEKVNGVLEISAPGTLAYSESKLVLKVLKDIEEDVPRLEKLDEKSLEQVSGGKGGTGCLSASLAFLLGSLPLMPNASAGVTHDATSVGSSLTKKVSSGVKDSGNRYSASKIMDAVGISVSVVVSTILIAEKIREYFNLKDVTTAIDGLSDSEVKENLNKQIEVYKNRDPLVFTIDNELIEKADSRTLLLVMMKINNIFEKYPVFTELLINYNKKYVDKSFCLKFSTKSESVLAITHGTVGIDFYDGYIGAFNFKTSLINVKNEMKVGASAPFELNQVIESVAAHEMGHVMQHVLFILAVEENEHLRNNDNYVVKDMIKKIAENMKKDILKIAREKYGNKTDIISQYGLTDSIEWFAEAFSHLECSNNPNPIGLALRDYLQDLFSKKIKVRID